MKKFSPTKEQREALQTLISNGEGALKLARYRLNGFARLVEQGTLPPAFLAFETLEQLALANEKGFDDDKCLEVVPEALTSKTVVVPVFLLNTILNCWDHFIHSDPTKASLEKSFGFASPKPKSNPIQHVIDKLDNDRYLATQVLIKRIENWSQGHKLPLAQVFANVAAEENVSNQTVKNAWYKHRSFYKEFLRDIKLPTQKIG